MLCQGVFYPDRISPPICPVRTRLIRDAEIAEQGLLLIKNREMPILYKPLTFGGESFRRAVVAEWLMVLGRLAVGDIADVLSKDEVSAPIAVSRLEQKKNLPLRSRCLGCETWVRRRRMLIKKPNEIKAFHLIRQQPCVIGFHFWTFTGLRFSVN